MTLTIAVDPELQDKLEQLAQKMGKSTEEVVIDALNEHLERLNKQRLNQEIQAFEQMHPELKRIYLDKFVAIYENEVVDADEDFESLFLRVQAQFGDLPVLIRQVGNSPTEEWHFRSPRLEQH